MSDAFEMSTAMAMVLLGGLRWLKPETSCGQAPRSGAHFPLEEMQNSDISPQVASTSLNLVSLQSTR